MVHSKPLAIDIFAGLGGWAEGLIAEGFDVIGFDITHHRYDGIPDYPGQLVLQDVLTLNGWQLKDADLIVASPPCIEFSYMAMPFSRGKQIEKALLGEGDFPDNYKGSRTIDELNALFNACFRIQREASEAAGRYIPMIVENVKGAQKWVGRSRWNFGSYHLWGDVPALMPMTKSFKNKGGSWFRVAHNTTSRTLNNPDGRNPAHSPHFTNPSEHIKQGGDWFSDPASMCRQSSSKSPARARARASAMIAKIPFELAAHIGRVFYRKTPINKVFK